MVIKKKKKLYTYIQIFKNPQQPKQQQQQLQQHGQIARHVVSV